MNTNHAHGVEGLALLRDSPLKVGKIGCFLLFEGPKGEKSKTA